MKKLSDHQNYVMSVLTRSGRIEVGHEGDLLLRGNQYEPQISLYLRRATVDALLAAHLIEYIPTPKDFRAGFYKGIGAAHHDQIPVPAADAANLTPVCGHPPRQ